MVQKPRLRASRITRAFALLLTAAVPMSVVPVWAAEPAGDGVTPVYDEAYYATLDYYGNLAEGSVVKSYALNGADALTDYGTYDEVVNLTDGTVPTSRDGATTFRFNGTDAPSHFYFEGKTTAPFAALPWTISMSYTLNGVPTKAEDLAGKTGVVAINLDIVPNEAASDYAKNNYTLEAMALFNQDDILSLKAEGAQVQLVGNLRMVLFLALPGEEQHFTIEVGAENFSFGGMTYLMVPATLSQLNQIAKLSDRKDELEDDYEKLNHSLDTTLDALNAMTGSLYSSAKGLDKLNEGRGTISAGKGAIYDGIDTSKLDLESIAALLDPVAEQVRAASDALTKSKAAMNTVTDATVSLKTELSQTENALENLEKDFKDTEDVARALNYMRGNLNRLESALKDMKSISAVASPLDGYDINQLRTARETVVSLRSAYDADPTLGAALPPEAGFEDYVLAVLTAQGKEDMYDVLMKVYQMREQMGADAFDFLLDNNGSVDSILDSLNAAASSVNSTLSGISGPTANVISDLANVCNKMGGLINLLDDGADVSKIGQGAAKKLQEILDGVKTLQTTLDDYEPKAQETLKTLEDLSVTAAGSIRNAEKLITDTESLAKTSGAQLDAGTKQTLEGLASTLRQTAAALATSKDIKNTKSNLDSVITDTWHEHTGGVDNLLNMDSTAEAVSLTSGQNPAPQSVQVLIRSQEIKVPEEEDAKAAPAAADKGTFWSRVGQMFKDFWAAITGIFH